MGQRLPHRTTSSDPRARYSEAMPRSPQTPKPRTAISTPRLPSMYRRATAQICDSALDDGGVPAFNDQHTSKTETLVERLARHPVGRTDLEGERFFALHPGGSDEGFDEERERRTGAKRSIVQPTARCVRNMKPSKLAAHEARGYARQRSRLLQWTTTGRRRPPSYVFGVMATSGGPSGGSPLPRIVTSRGGSSAAAPQHPRETATRNATGVPPMDHLRS